MAGQMEISLSEETIFLLADSLRGHAREIAQMCSQLPQGGPLFLVVSVFISWQGTWQGCLPEEMTPTDWKSFRADGLHLRFPPRYHCQESHIRTLISYWERTALFMVRLESLRELETEEKEEQHNETALASFLEVASHAQGLVKH